MHDEHDATKFEFPTHRSIVGTWEAEALPGTHVTGLRWALDPKNVHGRGRKGAWSEWGTEHQTTIEFQDPGVHAFYVEARDDVGGLTRAVALIEAVTATPTSR